MRRTTWGPVLVSIAIIGTLVYLSTSSSASSFSDARSPGPHRVALRSAPSSAPPVGGAVTEDDGILPDHVTVFDDEYPGISNLDPDLLAALREAAMDASHDGIEFDVNSGWRSPAYQNQLFREAVSEYGSKKEAARWVATADTSAHVSGDAVDIGPSSAAAWLSEHGARYGLCQTYRNESWHFELRTEAIDRRCPPTYADAAHDPNLGQLREAI